jgi:phage gp36-like protein
MPYATQANVLARYEADVVNRICWNNATEAPDLAKLDTALEDTAAEIDSYVSARYPLPLNPVPSILKTINIDLALYATALTADKMFDELERRAENWRKHLVMIAKGHAGLGIHEDASTDDPSPAIGTGASTGMFAKVVRI